MHNCNEGILTCFIARKSKRLSGMPKETKLLQGRTRFRLRNSCFVHCPMSTTHNTKNSERPCWRSYIPMMTRFFTILLNFLIPGLPLKLPCSLKKRSRYIWIKITHAWGLKSLLRNYKCSYYVIYLLPPSFTFKAERPYHFTFHKLLCRHFLTYSSKNKPIFPSLLHFLDSFKEPISVVWGHRNNDIRRSKQNQKLNDFKVRKNVIIINF